MGMLSNLSIRTSITNRGIKETVRGYAGYEDWIFEIEICFQRGQTSTSTIRAVPPSGVDVEEPPKHALDRIVRLITCDGGRLDPGMAFAAAASPDPMYSRDKDARAELTARLYWLEHERSAINSAIGRAFGDGRQFDTPSAWAAIGKTLGISFGTKYNERSERVIDESKPGRTVANLVHLAKTHRMPNGDPYLPKNPDQEFAPEPEPVKDGPFIHREITLFCWRTPYEGDDPQPGVRILGPHVIIEAHWTDPRRLLEDREDLEAIDPLLDVSPGEVPQRLRPIMQRLEDRYPGATVKALGTLRSSPPDGYPAS